MERIKASKEKPVRIMAYGTLRNGHGNFRGYLEGRSTLLGTYETSPNFTMYNGGFPIVIDKGETAIEYDLFEITDDDVLRSVHGLEGCTGIPGHERNWYDIKKMETPHGTAYMYVMHTAPNNREILPSGNWNKR